MATLSEFGINKGAGQYHQEIIYTLALLYNVISGEISNYLKRFGFSIGKLNTLVAIRHHGGEKGIKQVEVSEHLIVTPGNMAKMIEKMSHEGLVTRSALEGDRRVKILKVTAKGEKMLDQIWPGYLQVLESAVSGLAKGRQKQLADLLTEWFLLVHK